LAEPPGAPTALPESTENDWRGTVEFYGLAPLRTTGTTTAAAQCSAARLASAAMMASDTLRASIGAFDVDLAIEFFRGFVNHAAVTLHVDNLRGVNAHHQCETIFKAFGRALRMAVEMDPRMTNLVPSTKGSL
jgi:imidazoleglycerol phosphate dehydratase HisB